HLSHLLLEALADVTKPSITPDDGRPKLVQKS
ncbi:MAG TPA: LysR family transcriptional regulator, partial [Cupriavidus sp.]|nr:LysR family transcriptional regulator [Cupriavidus sp.]